MSLTGCIAKAGPALGQVDKIRILELAARHRAEGLSADDAGRKAVDAVAAAVQVLIDGYKAPAAPAPAAAPDESPQFTEAQARKQFEWRDLGQKDGVKTHMLFWYEKPGEKGTNSSMGRLQLTRYEGSSGWQIDSEGEKYPSLTDAKKAAIEVGVRITREQGWIKDEQPGNPAGDLVGDPNVGDMVKLTKPGLNGRINIAGRVQQILPDGRLEIRTQNDGIMTVAKSELGHKPTSAPALSVEAEDGDSPEMRAAKARALGALGDLGAFVSSGTRLNMMPEQREKLLPIMVRLLDGLIEMAHLKMQRANFLRIAKAALATIRKALGADVANDITLDDLQGAYITALPRHRDHPMGVDSKRDVVMVESIDEIEAYTETTEETGNAADRQPGVEPNRPEGQEPGVATPNGDGLPGADGRDGTVGVDPAGRGDRVGGDPRVPAGGTTAPGATRNPRLPQGQPPVPPSAAGSADAERGDPADDQGAQPDSITDESVEDAARANTAAVIERTRQQREAGKVQVEPGLANIQETLPILLPLQQKDVEFAEARFAVEDGYGVLFTNGTGTGKTFVALGVIKRQVMQGKRNVLIVAPSKEVIDGFIKSAPMLGLTVTRLRNMKDAGSGVVITTYANLRGNPALATRKWDLLVADEVQALNQNEEGDATNALLAFRALTMHPNGANERTRMLHPELAANMDRLAKEMKAAIKAKDNVAMRLIGSQQEPLFDRFRTLMQGVQEAIDAAQGAGRTRALFLSATPFAREKSTKWGQGYLFDWNKNFTPNYDRATPQDGYSNFMVSHFGWRIKNNSLTMPDPTKVNSGLMQRNFNSWLKQQGALAGRMLEVEPDYDRRFVSAQSGLGIRIDQAFAWFWDTQPGDLGIPIDETYKVDQKAWDGMVRTAMMGVREGLRKRFDYNTRLRLLESLKAEAAVPYITEQMRMGRKIVVFHDLIQGQTHAPFDLRFNAEETPIEAAVFAKWQETFDDLVTRNWGALKSPIETMLEHFAPDVGLLNGQQNGTAREATLKKFNSDDQGPMVLVVQSALEAGWSGHDTTGKYPRVLVNLGLPTTPTRSIQQEGRIYRVGQASNAMLRYFNTQTLWEFEAFANKVAKRASEAENLAMGEDARGLLDSIIESFEETGEWLPGHEGEGTGGKARDRELAAVLTDWDRAKTMYWAKLAKTAKNKAREGADWFATPEPLGMKMVEWADLREGETSMEPSAGDGAIARWLPDYTKRIAVELSQTLAPRLALVFDGSLRNHPFEDLHVTNKADGVIMNPPFGRGGSLAGPHLDKAFNLHLDEGGRLVALIPEVPAMEARLDKFLTGTNEQPTRVLGTVQLDRSDIRELRKGDTIVTSLSFARSGKLVSGDAETGYRIKVPGVSGVNIIQASDIRDVVSDGPMTETVPNSQGAHVVATIRLPADTFGRAGTKVMTRIVIIDKLGKDQAAPARVDYDFSGLGSVEELFDAIETLQMPERTKPRPVELDETPADAGDDGLDGVRAEPEPQAKPRDIKDARKKLGIELAAAFNIPVVEYITKGGTGNLLHGVILKHVTESQAREFDKVAWRKDGGVFVRVWELNDLLAKYPLPPAAVPNLSRGGMSTTTVSADKLRAAVTKVTMAWEEDLVGGPVVRVVETAADLPTDILEGLRAQGAEYTSRGLMMPDGRVFLIADQLANVDDGLRVLFHETYGHIGLQAFLGDSYDIQMGLLRMANPKLAAEANAWYAAYGQLNISARVKAGMDPQKAGARVRALAVEEALADRAMDDVAPKGWKMLMSRLQKALRDLGMDSVANWLEGMTEAETHALLVNARALIRGNPAAANTVSEDLAGGMRGEPVTDRRTVKQGRIRRTIDELVQMAEEQGDWRDWYDQHQATVEALFGSDATMFQKILSATSQLQTVKGNVTMALRAYEKMITGAPFVGFLPAVANNLERIRNSLALNGPKIAEFERGNLGAEDAIAVDRHIAQLLFNTSAPSRMQIESAKRRIREVARRLGWTAKQAQAALWAANQVRKGTDPNQVVSYDRILEARADLIEEIRARYGRGDGLPAGGAADARAGEGRAAQDAGTTQPVLSRAPAAAPAPAALKPSSAPLDAGLRIAMSPVSKVTSWSYGKAVYFSDMALGAALPGNTWEYVKAGVVDQYGLDPEHSEAKTQMRTAIRVNARKVGEIVDKLRALTGAESRIAYLWMNTDPDDATAEDAMKAAAALFDQLPEEAKAILSSLKADIEHLSDEAVELGLLSKEVRDRHAMAYMHRSYKKYETGEVGAKVARTRAISILGDQFKGRGMRDNATMAQIGTPDFWARKTRGDAHDPSLKGKMFHRLERRETPDSSTPQLFEDENGKPMGRIREIAYWPVDEPIPAKYADWRNDGQWEARFFNKSGKVGMWRDFTLAEREKLGEVQEVKYATAVTMMQMVRDVETARFLDWVARKESVLDQAQLPDDAVEVEGASYNLTRSYLKNEWVQVPTTKVPGTGVHKYANLAGRWIPGPVWNDIRQISELTDQGDLMKILSGAMRAWKISKTALSPVTHMNNVMSNFMLADIHDIQARHMAKALEAWLFYKQRGLGKIKLSEQDPALARLIEDYQDNGGDAGKFNEAEVREELFGPLLAELKQQIADESGVSASVTAAQVLDLLQHRQFRQAFAAAGNSQLGTVAKWIPKKMMRLYGVEDEVFRLAAFIKAREDGLTDQESGRFARESFLNYEITAPWINAMRRTGWPFFAFFYRAAPMLAKSFTNKPHKLLKYALVAGALGTLAYAMSGGDEDEERALLPKEKAGKIWGFLTPKLMRMPWNDRNGNPVFLDIRRWVPAGDFADVGQSNSAIPLPPPLMPGGPLMLLAGLVFNHDGFTDQPIRNKDTRWSNPDEAIEAMGDTADWLWKAVMPNNPLVPFTYSSEGLVKAARGDVVPGKGGQEKSSLAQAVVSTVGIKVGSYPIDALDHNAKSKTNAEIRRIESEAKSDIGRLERTGKTDEEKAEEKQKLIERAEAKIEDRITELREQRKAAGLR